MFLTFKYNNLLSDNSKFLSTGKKQLQQTNFTYLYSTGVGSAFEGFIIEKIIQGLRAVEPPLPGRFFTGPVVESKSI